MYLRCHLSLGNCYQSFGGNKSRPLQKISTLKKGQLVPPKRY